MRFAAIADPFWEEWLDGSYIRTAVGLPEVTRSDPARAGIIWQLWELSMSLFATLRPLVIDSAPGIDSSSIVRWSDLLGTLFLWGDGFRNGEVEEVLHDADDLRTASLTHLGAIAIILKSKLYRLVRPATDEEQAEAITKIQELDRLLEKARTVYQNVEDIFEGDFDITSALQSTLITAGDLNGGDCSGVSDEADRRLTSNELPDIARDLEEHIFSLMALVPTINNAISQINGNVNMPSDLGMDLHVSEPAWLYVRNVRDKFSGAHPKLIVRLGQANWERHVKITKTLDELAEVSNKKAQALYKTKSVFRRSSLFHDSGLGSSSNASKSGILLSSSVSHLHGDGLRIPSMPIEVRKGIPFTCNICGHMLYRIKSRDDWNVHVLADLQPYMCTFPSCQYEFITFPTRRSWADHEFNFHRVDKYWNCPRCLEELPSTSIWQEHLSHEHNITYSGSAYHDAIKIAENATPQPLETQQCPLCLVVPGHSQKTFVEHVGEHLEAIALTALPRAHFSASDVDSMSSTRTNNSESHLLNEGDNEFSSSKSTPSPPTDHFRLLNSKDLDHPETHPSSPHYQRPEKCPLDTCAKQFYRKFDKNRHTLKHFKGTLVCQLCPWFGSAGLAQFTRVDSFKRHLVERHGTGVGRSVSQGKKSRGKVTTASVNCTVCQHTFNDAQALYKHLDECILRFIEQRHAGQTTRRNVTCAQTNADTIIRQRDETGGTGISSRTALPESSTPASHSSSSMWSHDIPIGDDGLYHCPWEITSQCSHTPVSHQSELHKYVDEHRRPYRCINRLCGDISFKSEASLRRHERNEPNLHTAGHEYKVYPCLHESCRDSLTGVRFTKSSELRDHVAQQHGNSNVPCWSDSSRSSESPSRMDTSSSLDFDGSWDKFLDLAWDQIDSQDAKDSIYVDFPATTVGQNLIPFTAASVENSALMPSITDSCALPAFSNQDPSVPSLANPLADGSLFCNNPSLFGIRKDGSFDSVLSESLDYLGFTATSSEQILWPVSSSPTSTSNVLPAPRIDQVTPEETLLITQFDETGLSSMPADSLSLTSKFQQQWKRQRSSTPSVDGSTSAGIASDINGHLKERRQARDNASASDKQKYKKMRTDSHQGTEDGITLLSENTTGSELRQRSRRDDWETTFKNGNTNSERFGQPNTSYQFHSFDGTASSNEPPTTGDACFDIGLSKSLSKEPQPQNELQDLQNFQCQKCSRVYKSKNRLSHHLSTHQHLHQYPHCALTFDVLKDFDRHIETHDRQRERLYCHWEGCESATKGFTRKDNLTKHMRRFHGAGNNDSEMD